MVDLVNTVVASPGYSSICTAVATISVMGFMYWLNARFTDHAGNASLKADHAELQKRHATVVNENAELINENSELKNKLALKKPLMVSFSKQQSEHGRTPFN